MSVERTEDIRAMWGAFPPCTVVGIEHHVAKWRTHLCAECMSTIRIGDRYRRIVYRDDDKDSFAQYKTHDVCPIGEWR